MSYNTYSFETVNCILAHPSVGVKATQGEGLGSISIVMTNDRTAHDLAADGTVMVSKMPGRNGTVTITAQQTSDLHKWLVKWYNYLEAAAASEWAASSITIRSQVQGELTTCTGVSPQKLADRPYQAQGQTVTWNLMAADIQQENI